METSISVPSKTHVTATTSRNFCRSVSLSTSGACQRQGRGAWRDHLLRVVPLVRDGSCPRQQRDSLLGPPHLIQWQRHIHDSTRPTRLTTAFGLKVNCKARCLEPRRNTAVCCLNTKAGLELGCLHFARVLTLCDSKETLGFGVLWNAGSAQDRGTSRSTHGNKGSKLKCFVTGLLDIFWSDPTRTFRLKKCGRQFL